MRVHSIAEKASKEESLGRLEPAVELEEIMFENDRPDRKVKIGTGLLEDIREGVIRA